MAFHDTKHEVDFYPEITEFISAQLKSNFLASNNKELHVYWEIGELSSKLKKIVSEHPEECQCLAEYAQTVPPLNLDIFAVITDGTHFELLILEVKYKKSVGLNQWSQLVGYCIVSNARYGILINIDGGGSPRLNSLLQNDADLSKIVRLSKGNQIEHRLGFMVWDSITKNFEYTNLGQLYNISELSEALSEEFK